MKVYLPTEDFLFLDKKFASYRIFVTIDGELIDTCSSQLIKRHHLASMLRIDYKTYCKEKDKSFNNSLFQKMFSYLIDALVESMKDEEKFAQLVKEGHVKEREFLATYLKT